MPKICFVIGPIGDPGSQIRAASDDFMKYVVTPCVALKEFDYGSPIRADSLNEPGRITTQVIKLLMEADLVVADLSTNNANVYYELSLRHALGKPAIHMAESGTVLSFDVRDNRTIFYTMHSRAAEEARDELARQIRRIHADGFKATNPIIETIGIVNLEHSADPEQNALGQVLRRVETLDSDIKELFSVVQAIRVEQEARRVIVTPGANNLSGMTYFSPTILTGRRGVGKPTLSPLVRSLLSEEPDESEGKDEKDKES